MTINIMTAQSVFLLWLTVLLVDCTNSSRRFAAHPMLYYSADRIPHVIQQARTTHSGIADILVDAARTMIAEPGTHLPAADYKQFSGSWIEAQGNNLSPLAMYCVLFPEDRDLREFAFTFMDNLVKLPKWQVDGRAELPIAFTLTEFATAFDFLYPVMDAEQRTRYLARLVSATRQFYTYRKNNKKYLQNHDAIGSLALLHGSLVASLHEDGAKVWLEYARDSLEKNMLLLDHIVDGSLDEGVSYATYTSRAFTQYVYLAKRHFELDHTRSLWLREHFWLFYNTILPGFQRSVGIADSSDNWYYGPESQLVFLDAFVLRNGWGNWLANEIRRSRPEEGHKLAQSKSNVWCTVHTEFLWYDPSLRPTAPPRSGKPDIHVFSDWGVATYSKVAPNLPNDTFLAFKSGKMHGRGIFDIVQRKMYASWIDKWSNFNPGHEHPDQNMFVFAPNGQLFISDGLYGTKYTHLNNVLVFSPSSTSHCGQPWEGQLGECYRWLKFHDKNVEKYGGDLVTASLSDNMVHISGEARGAYNPSMKLTSVYRSVVLLSSNLLVVLDHVETQSNTPLTHAAAFFHNVDRAFEEDKLQGAHGAKMVIESKDYRMFWISPEGHSPKATFTTEVQEADFKKTQTNFINVTLELRPGRLTRMAYVLAGPSVKIVEISFLQADSNGVAFEVKTTNEEYRIRTVTRHDDPVARQKFLGYPGYVLVEMGKQMIQFGVNSQIEDLAKRRKKASSDIGAPTTEFNTGRTSNQYYIIFTSLLLILLVYYSLEYVRRHYRRRSFHYKKILVFRTVVTLGVLSIISLCMFRVPGEWRGSGFVEAETAGGLPSVVITSLPASGSEILGWVFYYNPDFRFIEVSTDFGVNPFVDSCDWAKHHKVQPSELANRIKSLRWGPPKRNGGKDDESRWVTKNKTRVVRSLRRPTLPTTRKTLERRKPDITYKVYSDADLLEHVKTFPNSQSVLRFPSGSWGMKTIWLDGVLRGTLRNVYVSRDPRAWAANFLRNDLQLYSDMNVAGHLSQLVTATATSGCRQFKALEGVDFQASPAHKVLALLWEAYTQEFVASSAKRSQVVRFEDVVMSPGSTANSIYTFIGFPLPPSMEQQLIQAAQSRVYRSPHEGVVHPSMLDRWKTELTASQISDVETICAGGMKMLNYK